MLRALLEKSDKLAERLSAIEQAKEPSHGNRSHTRKSHSHVVKKRSFVDKDGSRVTEVVLRFEMTRHCAGPLDRLPVAMGEESTTLNAQR